MLQAFLHYIQQKDLIVPHQKVLLAISGGMDSMVMLRLFHQSGIAFEIAHCNFGLRGVESDLDQQLVLETAKKLGIIVHHKRFDTKGYAQSNGLSIQMAARELRYSWFETLRNNRNLDLIATAHHQDDHTETVLINIIRGSGIKGLQGILPTRDQLIRPMLFATRADIERYAKDNNLVYREDASNADTKYLRNKIRHQLISLCKEINPSFNQSIQRLSDIALESQLFLTHYIKLIRQDILHQEGDLLYLSIEKLKGYPAPGLILYELLKEYAFTPEVCAEIGQSMNSQPGKSFFSTHYQCMKDRSFFILKAIGAPTDRFQTFVSAPGQSLVLGKHQLDISEILSPEQLRYEVYGKSQTALWDADRLSFPLEVRHARAGDYFIPSGMHGKKKISDFFTDLKLNAIQKAQCLVVVSGQDIVWVVGYRIDERYKATPKTQRIIMANWVS